MNPPCFCDGNGTIPCPEGCEDGSFHDCGEDCCPHTERGQALSFRARCESCDGRGFLRCPVHNTRDDEDR